MRDSLLHLISNPLFIGIVN